MFQEIIERLALALEDKKISYMFIGGQAVLLYGEPRLTKDIDLTVDRNAEQAGDILELVKTLGWKVLVDNPMDFVRQTMVLPCMDSSSGIRLDFIFSFSPYEKQAFDRVRRVTIGKAQARFASLEDLIIHKMVAGRARDEEDVKTLIAKNPKLDVDHVRHWLKQFEKDLAKPCLKRFEEIYQSAR